MRLTIRLFLILILVLCFSCEEQGLLIKCPDCTTDEPIQTNLEAKLDETFPGNEALITVYEGNLEDSIIYRSYRTSQPHSYITVTLNKKYTVTATYFQSGNSYVAVDSVTPKVKYEKEQCDNPCYFVYDKVVDLRLKYTK
jgi:hypothetical protein